MAMLGKGKTVPFEKCGSLALLLKCDVPRPQSRLAAPQVVCFAESEEG